MDCGYRVRLGGDPLAGLGLRRGTRRARRMAAVSQIAAAGVNRALQSISPIQANQNTTDELRGKWVRPFFHPYRDIPALRRKRAGQIRFFVILFGNRRPAQNSSGHLAEWMVVPVPFTMSPCSFNHVSTAQENLCLTSFQCWNRLDCCCHCLPPCQYLPSCIVPSAKSFRRFEQTTSMQKQWDYGLRLPG